MPLLACVVTTRSPTHHGSAVSASVPVNRQVPVSDLDLRAAAARPAERAADVTPIGGLLEKPLIQKRVEHRGADVGAEPPQLLDLRLRQPQPGYLEVLTPDDQG